MTDNTALAGQIGITDYNSDVNLMVFAIRQALARLRTAGPAQVKAVHAGAQSDQWVVDVQPMVSMVDGSKNSTPHGIVPGIQVWNISGANGSLCVQPTVNDIGLLIICDRDHSSVLSSKQPSPPSSGRQHDFSDGIFIGGFGAMNSNTQRIVMTPTGIEITGNVKITGALTATGGITAGEGTSDQVTLLSHVHAGVSSGSSSTSAPTAGT
jgi:hypothetical protein